MAVAAAYGWPADVGDVEALGLLLSFDQHRARQFRPALGGQMAGRG